MRDHRKEFSVVTMARVLAVSVSGYYAWRKRPQPERARENERLLKEISAVHAASRATYGSPKVYRRLRQQGETINHKRVARLMRENAIYAKRVKKFRTATTNSRHGLPVAENVLARKLTTGKPDEVWTSDITYVRTREGWLYLVVFLDLYSRLIVGWAVSESLESDFVEEAFLQGQARRGRAVSPLIHSDRGRKSREPLIAGEAAGVGLRAKYVAARQLLGQRRDRKFLRDTEG